MPKSDEQLYADIEERFGFSLPQVYRQMRSRGWFSLGSHKPGFHASETFVKGYLWLNEMEWMALEDICGKETSFFSYAKPGLIPFAFDGGGSHWCWFPKCAMGPIAPVVLCPRNCEVGEFYAPSFLGSLYRQILDFARCIQPEDEGDARQHFKRWIRDLGPFFPDHWKQTVARVAIAPLQDNALLDHQEYNQIVQRDLAFPMLNREFRWMVD